MSVPKKVRDSVAADAAAKSVKVRKLTKSVAAVPSKKPIRRRRATQVAEPEVTVATPVRRARTKKAAPSIAVTTTDTTGPEAVSLPVTISLRARRKAEAWRIFFDTELPKIMYYASYAYAVSFMVVGSLLCGLVIATPGSTQSAQLISALGSTSAETSNLPAPINAAAVTPTVSLVEELPRPMSPGSRFIVTTTNVRELVVIAESLATGNRFVFDSEMVAAGSYRVTVPAVTFAPGEYVIRTDARSVVAKHSFILGTTFVAVPESPKPEPLPEKLPPVETPKNTSSSTTNSEVSTATTSEAAVIKPPAVPKPEVPQPTEVIPPAPSSTPSEQVPTPPAETVGFSVALPSRVVSGWVPVKINAPLTHTKIELYTRSEQSISERFLGTAVKNQNQWFYSFDSRQLPDGSYQIIGRANVVGSVQSSPVWTFEVKNTPVQFIEPKPAASGSTTAQPVFSTESMPGRSTTAESEVREETDRVFENDARNINDLLQRYATALKTEDPTLLAAIDAEFASKREALLTEQLLDTTTKDMVSALQPEFEARFEELKERVKAFEAIRTERVEVTNDEDLDGITDHDEIHIYGTDPKVTDTDGDGFLDGVEIIRGFNPTNAAPEAVISYELPTRIVGLERPEVLSVQSVTPLIVEPSEEESKAVHAEIAGRGLPNSFVTIYIFSSPIIVTVKTDADGSFVYRFDKELEDGEHEVYVAFTDNTGAILAKSQPFAFVKQAEAFTPTNELGGVAESGDTFPTTLANNSYRLVVGLSIISLGLILLMLGISIKPRSKPLLTSQ